jgi:hypothetical protein
MCLKIIADCVPCFVANQATTKIQVSKALVFFQGAGDCAEFLAIDLEVLEKAQFEALQTTVTAQPIRDNGIVDVTKTELGRSLIASKDLCQSTCSSTRKDSVSVQAKESSFRDEQVLRIAV